MADETRRNDASYRLPSREARLLHGAPDEPLGGSEEAAIPPLVASTNFRFASVEAGAEAFRSFGRRTGGNPGEQGSWVYDRWDEPNGRLLEARLADLHGAAQALAFSTGMGAISAVACVAVAPGASVVVQRPLYGGTEELFNGHLAERLGVRVHWVEDLRPEAIAQAVAPDTALVHLETPANPSLQVVDIAGVAEGLASASGEEKPLLVVDNTFAGPWCQRPLELGADLVVESLTKYVGGFGTVMGGLVAGGLEQRELLGELLGWRASGGASLSPWVAWQMLVYGLPTLALRSRRQTDTAGRLASWLSERSGLEVRYPGLPDHPDHQIARSQMVDPEGTFRPGGMVYLSFAEGRRARRFLDHLAANARCVTLAASLGQIQTLVEAPDLMSHCEARGATPVDPGGVRMSVGIEPFEDLQAEIAAALEAC